MPRSAPSSDRRCRRAASSMPSRRWSRRTWRCAATASASSTPIAASARPRTGSDSMPRLKSGEVFADPGQGGAEGEPVPEAGRVLIPFQRWQSEREAVSRRNAPVGVRLSNTRALADVAPDLARFELIVLDFPKFVDGRAFTQARLLRERYGYRKELRATGNVLRDELQFMHRCGFDAFEIEAPDAAAQWRHDIRWIARFHPPPACQGAHRGAQRPSAHPHSPPPPAPAPPDSALRNWHGRAAGRGPGRLRSLDHRAQALSRRGARRAARDRGRRRPDQDQSAGVVDGRPY